MDIVLAKLVVAVVEVMLARLVVLVVGVVVSVTVKSSSSKLFAPTVWEYSKSDTFPWKF